MPFGNGNACAAQGLDQPWRSRGAGIVVAHGQGTGAFGPCPLSVGRPWRVRTDGQETYKGFLSVRPPTPRARGTRSTSTPCSGHLTRAGRYSR